MTTYIVIQINNKNKVLIAIFLVMQMIIIYNEWKIHWFKSYEKLVQLKSNYIRLKIVFKMEKIIKTKHDVDDFDKFQSQ